MKRRRPQNRGTAAILIILIIAGIIYVTSAGAAGNYFSKWIAPILNSEDDSIADENNDANLNNELTDNSNDVSDNGDNEKSSEDSESTTSGQLITDEIRIEPVNFYLIQLGAFSSLDNAEILSNEIKQRGGAGFIIEDGYFRVIGMGFNKENDAQNVKDNLKTQDVEAQVYPISCSGVNMQIKASEERVNGIKSSFKLFKDKILVLEQLVVKLDNDSITLESAYEDISSIHKELNDNYDNLVKYTEEQKENQILNGLLEMYSKTVQKFAEIDSVSKYNKVEFSSKIKYTYIEMINDYKNYLNQITN